MRTGAVILNPFQIPGETLHQAERLKSEFNKLGVSVDIITDLFLRTVLNGDTLNCDLLGYDFAIYLDKDKYQSEILQKLGLRIFNTHEAVRVYDDKACTYIALSQKDIAMPKTVFGALCYFSDLAVKDEWADDIISKLGLPVIVKESFGSMGKGVHLAKNKAELLALMNTVKLRPHIFQEYIGEKQGVDVRVIVIGGKVKCAMKRINKGDFRSNIAQGGLGEKIELDQNFIETAEKCAKTLGLDYCGVDLLFGKNGQPIVCEVNSNAFFSGIEGATGYNVAKAYAEHVIIVIYNK